MNPLTTLFLTLLCLAQPIAATAGTALSTPSVPITVAAVPAGAGDLPTVAPSRTIDAAPGLSLFRRGVPELVDEFGPDAAAVAASLLLVAGYYLFLWRKVRRNPTYSIHGVNEVARTLWVKSVMESPGKDVMAVQTLRNFIMGASLMATTASMLIIGTLTLSGQAESIGKSWHVLNAVGSHAAELWIVKVLCLLADFIVAFFAFVMAVRLINHVVFMLNIPRHEGIATLAPEQVARRLNRAGNFFAVGMRAFFFAVPLVFWLFGPALLVAASLGLVITLYRVDRNPPERQASAYAA